MLKSRFIVEQIVQLRKRPWWKINSLPGINRTLQWIKLVSLTGAAQLLVQVLSFLCGIFIIRLLTLEEYALYTLANAYIGTMAVLIDGGISAGVLSQGGKCWKDKDRLGSIVATGLQMRSKFAVVGFVISLPILGYLLMENGASIVMVALIGIAIIPTLYAELSDSILDIAPKLHQEIPQLQKNQVAVGLGRLLLTISIVFFFPFTFIVLISNGLPRIYGNFQLRKIAAPFITSQEPDKNVRKEIFTTVKGILPGAVYFCLSGQITLWIFSILGNSVGLAQLGALGRIGMALSIIGMVANILLIPRFARKINNVKQIKSLYFKIVLAVLVVLLFITLVISMFPTYLLWLLGESYINLDQELIFAITGAGLAILYGVIASLNMSRNWIISPILLISISLVSIVAGLFLFEISELKGVLLFNIFLAVTQVGIHGIYGMFRLSHLQMIK